LFLFNIINLLGGFSGLTNYTWFKNTVKVFLNRSNFCVIYSVIKTARGLIYSGFFNDDSDG